MGVARQPRFMLAYTPARLGLTGLFKAETFRLGFLCFGLFFGLGFEGFCGLRLSGGLVETFNVDSMLTLLSDMGAAAFSAGMF